MFYDAAGTDVQSIIDPLNLMLLHSEPAHVCACVLQMVCLPRCPDPVMTHIARCDWPQKSRVRTPLSSFTERKRRRQQRTRVQTSLHPPSSQHVRVKPCVKQLRARKNALIPDSELRPGPAAEKEEEASVVFIRCTESASDPPSRGETRAHTHAH